ncbi:MAG: FAD/NAD(P)-binding oxidoreductase [bacterium]|jgi:sulfide:quinone oxidoreductase
MKTHYQIIVVGGGNAGISVSAQLLNKDRSLDIAIIEPSSKHYYQPAWSLVGAGIFNKENTVRDEASVIPKKAFWIKNAVKGFIPDENKVELTTGESLTYDYLIVAAGIQLNWNEIKGLKESLGKNGVCSNYDFKYADYTWECIKKSQTGRAIFTNPNTAVKCGGAPQKIMYLASDYFGRQGLKDKIQVEMWSGGTKVFGVPKYEEVLKKLIERRKINMNFFQKLVEVDGPNKRAKFVGIGEANKDVETWIDYEMIHITPPQSAPDFVKQSPLANAAGWVDVDKYSLQHNKYNNIFSLGDVSSLPTSRTGAAVRKQAPVLVKNLLAQIKGEPLSAKYNGYTSCPIVTGYGKLMLAEFDYENKPTETFPFNQAKERWSMFILKRYILPWLYWNQILPGRM